MEYWPKPALPYRLDFVSCRDAIQIPGGLVGALLPPVFAGETRVHKEEEMASIHEELAVDVSSAEAWEALRQVQNAHKLFSPVTIDGQLVGDIRTVTFANGMVARERILNIDDDRRRVAYTVLDAPGMSYHHASMQVMDAGLGRCVFHWTTDFLPPEAGSSLTPLIQQGARALKRNLEGL
jgi:hypothetical protein